MAKFSVTVGDAKKILLTWASLLRNLTFSDNFRGYEWAGEITAGQEKRITHDLKVIPSRFLVIEAKGTMLLAKGTSPATANFFYVKNVASISTFNGKLLILP